MYIKHYKIIIQFILLAVLYFALTLGGWLLVFPMYQEILIFLSNACLRGAGLQTITELRTVIQDSKLWVGVFNIYQASMQHYLFCFSLDSVKIHVPMFTALVMSTPFSAYHRLRWWITGFFFLTLFEVLTTLMTVHWSYTFLPPYKTFSPFYPNAVLSWIVNFTYYMNNLIGIHIIPIILWGMLYIRKEEIKKYFKRFNLEGYPVAESI